VKNLIFIYNKNKNMSIEININELSDSHLAKVNEELKIELNDKYSFGPTKYMIPYEITDYDSVLLPFAYSVQKLNLKRRSRDLFTPMTSPFEGELRDEQNVVKTEAISILNKKGSVILSMYCGFGKTITSINLACAIGMKTLVIVNKLVLIKQWEESINRFCPSAVVQKVTPKSQPEPSANFLIINAINTPKLSKEFFSTIGVVIVDEAHLIMAETVSKCMQSISPRYLIGLTATPYRPDGLDALLEFYFGIDKIIRELWREHLVYKVETGFEPIVELTAQGRMNWGSVLDSQSKDKTRNELIVDIISHFKERNFLVMVKRVEQGELLEKMLLERGEDVTSLVGARQTFEVSSRILIGTCSKVGTGFDHPRLDTLLLAADVEEYFIQYLGRCMRTRDGTPIVFDIVDDNGVLKKHYNTRKKIYLKHGGKIQIFDKGIL
jgi:superfamily II DNA or RNA helicase